MSVHLFLKLSHVFLLNKQGNAQADKMHANLAIFPTTSKEIVEMEWQLSSLYYGTAFFYFNGDEIRDQ